MMQLFDHLQHHAAANPDGIALARRQIDGTYEHTTWRALLNETNAFATAFKWVANNAPADIAKIEATKTVVDEVLPEVPTYGGVATSLADLGYAALGEIASVITTGTAAQKQSLSDAGLDNSVITAIEAAVKGFGSIGGFIASLVSKK